MSYETLLSAIRKEMAGEPAETQIEYRIDCLVRELDELCTLAANPGTVALVEAQKIGVGQIKMRADLILSFLLAQKPSALRLVQNNG
jgi:hypothetical protein